MRFSRYLLYTAMRDLSRRGEFTQYDLHAYLEERLGRPLTQAEKTAATQYVEHRMSVKERRYDSKRHAYIVIFML